VQNALLVPFQGTRYQEGGTLTGKSHTALWSSSVTATNTGATSHFVFYTDTNGSFVSFYEARASRGRGFGVRCFANERATVATVKYSTTEKTKDAVIATISFNKADGAVIETGGREKVEEATNVWTKTFTQNTQETVHWRDGEGKEGSSQIMINRIYPRAKCEKEVLLIEGYAIATCNVGATIAGTGGASYGLLYQWGNNFGFPTTGPLHVAAGSVDTSDYGWQNPYVSEVFTTTTTEIDWANPQNNALWGGASSGLEAKQ
jgi:hypothetical protein